MSSQKQVLQTSSDYAAVLNLFSKLPSYLEKVQKISYTTSNLSQRMLKLKSKTNELQQKAQQRNFENL